MGRQSWTFFSQALVYGRKINLNFDVVGPDPIRFLFLRPPLFNLRRCFSVFDLLFLSDVPPDLPAILTPFDSGDF